MTDKKLVVFDIEANSLNATKIHVVSYQEDGEVKSITDYEGMRKFFLREDIVLIGHNVLLYDLPTIERILKIKVAAKKVIDTLPLSWYLEPGRKRHGLEGYGDELGIKKPEVKDWENGDIEVYKHRCQEDTKINTILWNKQYSYLRNLYDEDLKAINRFTNYLQFKMECVRDQEELGIRLDVERCTTTLEKLIKERDEKLSQLKKVMPKVPVYKTKEYEESVMDSTGNLAMKGELFYTPSVSIPRKQTLKVLVKQKDPNPRSVPQVKNWLYSMGWVPEHIKHVRDKKTNETKEVPQIGSKDGGGEVCDSVKKLFDKEPKLELLNGLSVVNHRIALFEGFLKDQKDGRLYPSISGLTNTMRMQHKVVVNLPGVGKPYGEDVRGCLIADEGHTLLGADLSNIEDRTKRHYIYQYDPAYVEEMNRPDFDAHLDIGIKAKMITEEESNLYKEVDGKLARKEPVSDADKKEYKRIKLLRHKAKTTNFSATYKVGAPTLSRNSGMALKEAKKLLNIFWERNEAILKVEESLHVKEIGHQKWLQNPINGYWYSLRADKDKFSTLNQGSAVYVFDLWLTFIRKMGLKIPFQMHDEFLKNVPLGKEEETDDIIQGAIEKVNNKLKLNIQVGCSAAWGMNYAECH